MPEEGYRQVTDMGRITLPKDFRDDNNIEEGEDQVNYYRHSRDRSKLIIEAQDQEEKE